MYLASWSWVRASQRLQARCVEALLGDTISRCVAQPVCTQKQNRVAGKGAAAAVCCLVGILVRMRGVFTKAE